MKTEDDPGATYARCLADEQGHLAGLRRWLTWLVRVRIANLVLGIVLAGEACSRRGHFGLAAAASALVFVGLTIAIALVEHRSKRHEARVRYCEDGLARVQGRPIKGAPDGQRFVDPAHPYAADLDIFGPASIFSHVCMARTGSGQRPAWAARVPARPCASAHALAPRFSRPARPTRTRSCPRTRGARPPAACRPFGRHAISRPPPPDPARKLGLAYNGKPCLLPFAWASTSSRVSSARAA